MKKNKYIVLFIACIQIFMFYIFPLSLYFLYPFTTIIIILLITFILSFILSIITNNKLKYLYPFAISILFLPTIFIYYNESAFIHSLWYLTISIIGLILGTFSKSLTLKAAKKYKTKKLILVIPIIIFVILGIIIYLNNNRNNIGKESNITIVNNGISLSIKDNTLTKSGVTLIIKNDSNDEIIYTDAYEIQIKKDNKWHKINIEISFIEPIIILKPRDSNEIKINWENEYGKLNSGEYRIIKKIIVSNKNNAHNTLFISKEFII